MPAEALEVTRACCQRAVQVEVCDRAAGSLPPVVRARDEHDRPVEPLDEARGDDADDALVPVLAPEYVAAVPLPRLRHGLDGVDGLAQDPFLDCLAVAIQLLECVRVSTGLVGVLGEHELEGDVGATESSSRIDARSEPEAHRAGVDCGRIDARASHECL